MKLTHYEFEIFDDILYGELEPKKLYDENLNYAINYLKDEVEKCEVTIFGVFKNKNRNLQLVEQMRMSNAHPLAYQYINQNTLHKAEDITEQISIEAFESLQVNTDNLLESLTSINSVQRNKNFTSTSSVQGSTQVKFPIKNKPTKKADPFESAFWVEDGSCRISYRRSA